MAQNNISTIKHLGKIIKGIEKEVKSQVQLRKEFVMLTTIPGVGLILGLTIMLEVGDIGRFFKVGNYSSYCRCVSSKRLSNGKKKGRTIRRMVINTWLGPMLKQLTLPKGTFPRPKDFINKKWPKPTELLLPKPLLTSWPVLPILLCGIKCRLMKICFLDNWFGCGSEPVLGLVLSHKV